MLNLATLKAKLILGAVIMALLGLFGGYVWHLHSKAESLQKANTELSIQAKAATDTVTESQRRDTIVDTVNNDGNKERVVIEKHYQDKVQKIDENVQQGKDSSVGPLLNEYFNGGL